VGYFEGFEGFSGTINRTDPGGGAVAGTSFSHLPGLNAAGGFMDSGGALDIDSKLLEGFAPGSAAGITPDIPQGSSAVDGSRCQYDDIQGPVTVNRSESGCRPWNGSDWHVTNFKSFTGANSFYAGVNGDELGEDESFDNGHTNAHFAAFSGSFHLGVSGGATLSVAQIAATTDDRTFNVPDGNAAGRGILEWAIVDPDTGKPVSSWNKLNGFQNNYGNTGVDAFGNCMFDSYDGFYDTVAALGATPGFDLAAANVPGNLYNADNLSSEDDYFDPNDPTRRYGSSASCFPQFCYSSLGDWTSLSRSVVGKAFTEGEPGENAANPLGRGIWIKSLFNLDQAFGRTIRVRYTMSDVDIGVGFLWADLFGNTVGNGVRGWIFDDMAVSGVLDAKSILDVDGRDTSAFVPACPVDPIPGTPANEAACSFVTAVASDDLAVPVSGSSVTLDAAASSSDACVNGHLEYQWRIGGTIVQAFSTSPSLLDAPVLTTQYSVTVRCSTDPDCAAADNVVVNVLDQREGSGIPGELMFVDPASLGTNMTFIASEPSIGSCASMAMFRNSLLGLGGELRQASLGDRSGAALGAELRADLCSEGTLGDIGGGQFSLTLPTATAAGPQINGFLAVGTCQGIQGILGRIRAIGESEVGRGGVPGGVSGC
jgi:hypothetical protein